MFNKYLKLFILLFLFILMNNANSENNDPIHFSIELDKITKNINNSAIIPTFNLHTDLIEILERLNCDVKSIEISSTTIEEKLLHEMYLMVLNACAACFKTTHDKLAKMTLVFIFTTILRNLKNYKEISQEGVNWEAALMNLFNENKKTLQWKQLPQEDVEIAKKLALILMQESKNFFEYPCNEHIYYITQNLNIKIKPLITNQQSKNDLFNFMNCVFNNLKNLAFTIYWNASYLHIREIFPFNACAQPNYGLPSLSDESINLLKKLKKYSQFLATKPQNKLQREIASVIISNLNKWIRFISYAEIPEEQIIASRITLNLINYYLTISAYQIPPDPSLFFSDQDKKSIIIEITHILASLGITIKQTDVLYDDILSELSYTLSYLIISNAIMPVNQQINLYFNIQKYINENMCAYHPLLSIIQKESSNSQMSRLQRLTTLAIFGFSYIID